jgi:predicted component of type VI protein secretion system
MRLSAPQLGHKLLDRLTGERDRRTGMEGRKAELLQRIESDREVLLDFLRGFIRCPSPNPPGDTREAADHIRQFLKRHGVDIG